MDVGGLSLYRYQDRGAAFLARANRAYLADGAGLGKTIQFCVAAKRIGTERTLVVAPASALENWEREWRMWGPDAPLQVTSYASLIRQPLTHSIRWDLVGLDEAHYTKSATAQRTRVALPLAAGARRKWLLSATPMPNHPGELWTVFRGIWPEVPRALGLETDSQWFNHFCLWTQTRYGKRVYGTRNLDQLRPYLHRIMLRRKLGDPEVDVELPPLRVDVSLLPKDASFARELEAMGVDVDRLEARMRREESAEDGSVSRLRRLLGEYKAPRIAAILADELESHAYPKVVVMAHHRAVLDVLRAKLQPYGVAGFDGSMAQGSRQAEIDRFTEDPSVRVFVAQQTAAGVAVNLQVANEIVLVEPSSVPDENYQILKRVHRIGSADRVRARLFAVSGTLDEGYMRSAARKTETQVKLGL